VAGGRPDGVMDTPVPSHSAAALRERGLVTTASRGASWSASITEPGRNTSPEQTVRRFLQEAPPADVRHNFGNGVRVRADVGVSWGNDQGSRIHRGLLMLFGSVVAGAVAALRGSQGLRS
jgi:hypothetical protein